jgi:hypothetical protein
VLCESWVKLPQAGWVLNDQFFGNITSVYGQQPILTCSAKSGKDIECNAGAPRVYIYVGAANSFTLAGFYAYSLYKSDLYQELNIVLIIG